jgi:hypothetical protein
LVSQTETKTPIKESSREGFWGEIFRHHREEAIGGWRKLHKEELYDLCPSPNIIRVTEPSRTRLAG